MTLEEGGYANPVGNDWGGATPELNPGTFTSAPYSYSLGPTTGVSSSGELWSLTINAVTSLR